jgi:hypothetical protein
MTNNSHQPQYIVSLPSEAGPKEHWEMVRSAIVHEDNLCNHRFTWLLSLHSFLFIAFGTVQSGVLNADDNNKWVLELCLVGLFIAALFCTRSVLYAIALAQTHLDVLNDWWTTHYPSEAHTDPDVSLTLTGATKVAQGTSTQQRFRTQQPPIRGNFPSGPMLRLSFSRPAITVIPRVFQIIDIALAIVSASLLIQHLPR